MTTYKRNKKRQKKGSEIETLVNDLLKTDPYLLPYKETIKRRLEYIETVKARLLSVKQNLTDFASGHEYFGLHKKNDHWIFREWAPNAVRIYFIGDITNWEEQDCCGLKRVDNNGVWEIRFPLETLKHGDLYRLRVHWHGGEGDRIPAYARRVVQDSVTHIFNAQVWMPTDQYKWQNDHVPLLPEPLYIYETHIGIAQEDEKVSTYREFTKNTLPRIVKSGYNTIQIMAIQEHPYYGSFGYHVTNFFAVSSRFGTPEEFKELVDAAHSFGVRVIMDIVHSHAASNEVEGLSRFDGTQYQYFHGGYRGKHPAWDSRCFDYGKHQVLHFLLSNCRFFLDEYHLDGYRFDGITSMLYSHHGLGRVFAAYENYYDSSVDEDALAYLALANRVVHDVKKEAITVAEDVSGMPGIALAQSQGGCGFDFRYAMGIPDYWIKLTKDISDEHWDMGQLWHELTNRRLNEKSISYTESHDQALVGDQTLIFRLIGSDMYTEMNIESRNIRVDRGIALHKIIRLITLATAGNGYLNFMGNEFGHPEWIDFPREGNGWSYHYARRQWHLVDDSNLRYCQLQYFDHAMLSMAQKYNLLKDSRPHHVYEHNTDKIIAFSRKDLLFVFNFHHERSYPDYLIPVAPGNYISVFNSDAAAYGGYDRLREDIKHTTLICGSEKDLKKHVVSLYLPCRTAIVFQRVQ